MTRESKHTPGPWRQNLVLGSADGVREIRESNPGGSSRIIARVFGFNELDAQLNARLIAAAPSMYEALKRVGRYFEQNSVPEAQGIACDVFAALAMVDQKDGGR